MVRFSGDPGRGSTRIPAEKHERQSRGWPRPDRGVEGAHDEEPPTVRIRKKQNGTVAFESERRGQTVG